MRWLWVCSCALALGAQHPRGEVVSRATDRTGLAITLYHQGFAVVRDRRRVELPAGAIRLAFADLSPKLRPKTALFEPLPPLVAQQLEQNFEFNLLSPHSLVQGSLDQRVVIRSPGGSKVEGILASLPVPADIFGPPRSPLEAKLDPMPAVWRAARVYRGRWAKVPRVRKDPDVVIRTASGVETSRPDVLSFQVLPPGLRSSPTLVENLETRQAGTGEVQLTYLTEGLSWSVQYTAFYHPSEDRMDLLGMVTLTNESGAPFAEAHLQLVAGDPNFVEDPDPEPPDPDATSLVQTTLSVVASRAPSFEEEQLADYHLYTLDRPTTLAQGQTKQLQLLRVEGIPVDRLARADVFDLGVPGQVTRSEGKALVRRLESSGAFAWEPLEVKAGIAWSNTEAVGLGRPLPTGQIHLLESRPKGTMVPFPPLPFESVSRGERMECWPATSGSWRGDRRMTSIRVVPRGLEVTWEIRLNHEGSDLTPLVLRQMMEPGATLLHADVPFERPASNQLRFTIPPPPEGSTSFTFTVRSPWSRKA